MNRFVSPKKDMHDTPQLLQGGLAVDDRGETAFVNDFSFENVKRFYVIRNHKAGFIRAWHGHKKEAKYATVISGSALIGAVAIDDFDNPSQDAQVHRFVLSAHKPSMLFIPAGYANGAMNLTHDTNIIFFSTTTMEEAKDDDFRYASHHWDIWTAEER